MPISRSTMAIAVSTAMPCTLAMAAVLVAAMVCFGLGELRVELGFERLAGVFRLGVELVAGLVGQRLGAGAGIGQRLLVGRERRVGLVLEAVGLGEIAVDPRAARLDDAADARDREPAR